MEFEKKEVREVKINTLLSAIGFGTGLFIVGYLFSIFLSTQLGRVFWIPGTIIVIGAFSTYIWIKRAWISLPILGGLVGLAISMWAMSAENDVQTNIGYIIFGVSGVVWIILLVYRARIKDSQKNKN